MLAKAKYDREKISPFCVCGVRVCCFLEAQLLYNYMDGTDLVHHNVTFSFVDYIFVVVDRFGRSLRFCHLEYNKEANCDGIEE